MSEEESQAPHGAASNDPLESKTQRLPGVRSDKGAETSEQEEREAGVETATYSRDQAPPVPLADRDTILSRPSGEESAAESSSKTAIAPSASLHPMLLERIEPSLGRGERLRLDAAHWKVRLGRADHNDLRLYTESASREHATIAGNEAGEWVLSPAEGKRVEIDGEATEEPVVLEVGMNLVLGGDHLRCVTEGLERSQMAAQTSAEGLDDTAASWSLRLAQLGPTGWVIAGVALLGLGLLAFAWFGG